MSLVQRIAWAALCVGVLAHPALAQQKAAIAATVNGQTIPETAVQRALKRIPPDKQAEARDEVLQFLIDNLLLDQSMMQAKIAVDTKDIDERVKQVKDELEKQGQKFEKMLQDLQLTEAELRQQISSFLRWEKYVEGVATDKVLREKFEKNRDMFDGTMVRARHILVTPATPAAAESARAQLMGLKKQVETQVADGLAKLPATADALAREKERVRLTEAAFAELAREKSECPSKSQGGDLGWFPRAGSMVEPFARTAFTLKTCEMSDVVVTRFGLHLILATDRRAGKDVKFEDVKDVVRDVYGEQLREEICAKLRQGAKIEITPIAPANPAVPKP
jgi:peptidyl-prolyl cis-trans isomerase C